MNGGGQPGGALGKYSGELDGVPAGSELERMHQALGLIGVGPRPMANQGAGSAAPLWSPQPQSPIISGSGMATQPPPGLANRPPMSLNMSPFDTTGGVAPMQANFAALLSRLNAAPRAASPIQQYSAGLPGSSPANAMANWQPSAPVQGYTPPPQQPMQQVPQAATPAAPAPAMDNTAADDYSRQLEEQRYSTSGGGE